MKLCRDCFILLESRISVIVLLYFQSFPLNSCVHLFDRLSRENWITLGSLSRHLFDFFFQVIIFDALVNVFCSLFIYSMIYLIRSIFISKLRFSPSYTTVHLYDVLKGEVRFHQNVNWEIRRWLDTPPRLQNINEMKISMNEKM